MAPSAMSGPFSLRLPQWMWVELESHLFPGDDDEHGAVIGTSVAEVARGCRLLGRRLFLATDGIDYVPGQRGYRMLTPDFVRRCALACADEGLAYLAIHNHRGVNSVGFSRDDMASHRRGYPALLDILDGPPVGALVFARRAVAGDIWLSSSRQVELDHAVIIGRAQQMLYAAQRRPSGAVPRYDRQVRLFGDRGQDILSAQKVGIVGAGGAGSLINEYLSRLGVGHLAVVDPERVDRTNFPRLVGARPRDLAPRWLQSPLARVLRMRAALKVDIAERVAREANPRIRFDAIAGDVAEPGVVEQLLDCDAIFLAADSMTARLVVNAICHRYLIPTWQVGAKVQADEDSGEIHDVFSVVRRLLPGETCLWCNELIDASRLAEEAVSTEQRRAQRYIDEVPAPSVITLNAVATAHAVNDYLFATVGLPDGGDDLEVTWTKHRPLNPKPAIEIPRRDAACTECHGRLGAGGRERLPVQYSLP
ncbi:MAG: ThiF family adenylyltransferase [Acidimicrobiaceae bacterium]|nr:ThiF family adenylyltransferase [Acidimicrobiaceae bacterium]MYH78641.1 ThiF family adenylyltransferase [Acidimicrobiaceae bacterium]MYK66514.1 ThiF family adenylyltransferase [Gemmatimonadota bacterium]